MLILTAEDSPSSKTLPCFFKAVRFTLFILMFLLQIWRVTKGSGEERYWVQNAKSHEVLNIAEQRYKWAPYRRQYKKQSGTKTFIRVGESLSQTDGYTPPETVRPLLWLCTLWQQPSFHPKGNPYLATWQERNVLMRHCSVWPSTPLQIKMTKCLHTLLWSQCSFPRLQSKPQTCHRGTQCTVCKTWHFHSSPDLAGSILQKKVNKVPSVSMNIHTSKNLSMV